jgi:hypothetical protein
MLWDATKRLFAHMPCVTHLSSVLGLGFSQSSFRGNIGSLCKKETAKDNYTSSQLRARWIGHRETTEEFSPARRDSVGVSRQAEREWVGFQLSASHASSRDSDDALQSPIGERRGRTAAM